MYIVLRKTQAGSWEGKEYLGASKTLEEAMALVDKLGSHKGVEIIHLHKDGSQTILRFEGVAVFF